MILSAAFIRGQRVRVVDQPRSVHRLQARREGQFICVDRYGYARVEIDRPKSHFGMTSHIEISIKPEDLVAVEEPVAEAA